jgi:hypothetical protein
MATQEQFVVVKADLSLSITETEMLTDSFAPDTTDGPFTVTGASNSSPITITISGTHTMPTGRVVEIHGLVGNTSANDQIFIITNVSSNQFSLQGSAGNGNWISGGTVTPRKYAVGKTYILGCAVQERIGIETNACVVTGGGDKPPADTAKSRVAY